MEIDAVYTEAFCWKESVKEVGRGGSFSIYVIFPTKLKVSFRAFTLNPNSFIFNKSEII
jgi:hypothetical protein